MFKLRGNEKGFTLIELIVVMAIIGILVLLATPKFLNYIKDANVTALQADVKVLGDGGMYHYIRHDNRYPIDLDTDGNPDIVGLDEIEYADGITEDEKTKYEEVIKGYYYETLGMSEADVDEELKWDTVKDDIKLAKFNPQEMAEHIRNTRSPLKDFYLVVDGPMTGEVFYNRVLENSIGESFIGLIGIDLSSADQ